MSTPFRPWTEEETQEALRLRDNGMSIGAIGVAIGRPTFGVYRKLDTLARLEKAGKPMPSIVVRAKPVAMPVDDRSEFAGAMPAGHPISCAAIGIRPWWPARV